ncbi:myosin phosphatase Rho-interacting protein-like [Oncorhynchus masou masou]|uniref:myosin phosphatase Rho-interacting protein-like n=1 Tax=Oncorhynchus masou masou TaxID=90313 RepID=UPI0031843770
MSGQKSANPCNKFQANIFYKSKCQNCFKSRELHLPTDHGKDQAKPIYGGWLCLAAEGTDFDNPIQRSRKWQRRFFILYEHGSMSFALDELTSTLPQGTVNMNLCTAVIDAEPKTGQRNALCIITPEQEFFIRGENKEIINGWSEQLVVYPRTYKQNQKKKRKVEPTTSQEPSPAKMAATEPSFSVMKTGDPCSSLWQGERPSGGPDVAPVWTVTDTDPLGLDETPAASSDSLTFDGSLRLSNGSCISSSVSSLDSVASKGTDTSSDSQRTEPTPYRDHTPANKNNMAERSCYNAPGKAGRSAVGEDLGQAGSRKGRSEARSNQREKLQSCGDLSPGQLTVPPPQRRAKSLDRRTSESVMTPDLLNFKKGWMMNLDKEDQWRKYWFVLSADSLRYYKDSFAEENSDLEGEIDLTKCQNVSEHQVQRNYGFQIHTQKCVYTLSAMTAGIRRNWIQALMKNVHPSNAPDVASSLQVHHIPCSPSESLPLPKPDVTQDSSPSSEVPTERVQGPKQSRIRERRREGRSKTFDWAEFSPMALLASEQEVQQETKEPLRMEVGDLERKRRREERRRRYDSMLGFLVGWEMDCDRGGISPRSPRTHQRVQREIEQCWQQVERTAFRQEKTVPLYTESQGKDKEDMGILLETYHRRVEELKGQLAESDHRRLELEAHLSTALGRQHHASLPLEAPMCPEADLPSLKSLTDMYRETRSSSSNRNSLGMGETQERANSVRIDNLLCCETPRPTEEYVDPDQAIVMRRLSQEVELLSSQNEALNQRNQEMLNQLTEADREIERLKAELITQYSGPQFLPEAEQHSQTKMEGLEKELRRRDEQLQEAQSLLASMDQRLKETEVQLQLREDTFKDPAEEDDDDEEEEAGEENIKTHHLGEKKREHLQQCLQAMEAKQLELERQLQHTEQTCRDLQFNEEVEKERTVEKESGLRCSSEGKWQEEVILDSGEERVQQVMEGIRLMSRTLGRVVQVIDRSDLDVVKMPLDRKCVEVNKTVVRQLQLEEEFWGRLLNSLKVNPSQSNEDKLTDVILSQILEHMVVEKQTLLLAHTLFSHNKTDLNINTGGLERMNGCRSLRDLDIIGNIAGETGSEMKEEGDDERIWNVYNQHNDTDDFISRHFTEITQERIFLLNQIASSGIASANDELQSLAQRLCHFHNVNDPQLASIHCTAMEAFSSYRLSRLNTLQSQFQETQQGLLIASSPLMCSRCAGLLSENQQLGARQSDLERQGSSSVGLGLTPLRQGEHIDSQQTATQLLDTASEQKTEMPAMNAAGKMDVESPNQGVTAVEEVCWVRRCAEVVEGDFLTNSIESPMIKVESRVDEVESRVDEVESRVDEVESRVDEVESRVDEVESRVDEVESRVDEVESRVDEAESRVDEVESRVDEAESRVDEAESRVDEVESRVDEVESRVDEAESRVDEVESRVDEVEKGIQEVDTDKDVEERSTTEPHEEANTLGEEELEIVLSSLRGHVKDLEEQLSVMANMKAEHDGRMASLQLKHNEDIEKLKATYEHGFVTMEESQQRIVGELQHRHQQDLQRLQLDTDRLLEEETAATITAIEAMKNAHRAEVKREIQRACHENNNAGDVNLGEICRQHSEELVSCHRELGVLSQQYSLKCLESSHLGQALEAERQALCQCQQENQDLRTCNQELSGHLAAEITRLCSLAKQDTFPLSQERDVYELEISLRVKESEVQCLKQKITSLKDELQSAHRDKRYATETYKDIYTELSIMRAKAERDLGHLRENLRLAHKALGDLSPAVDTDNNECQGR